jgi:hypothetical protein
MQSKEKIYIHYYLQVFDKINNKQILNLDIKYIYLL